MLWTQTQPTYPVTFTDAAYHARIDLTGDAQDVSYVNSLIATATDYAETTMMRALMPRTVTVQWFAWATPPDYTYLPIGPVLGGSGGITSLYTTTYGPNNTTIQTPVTNFILEASGNYSRIRINNSYTFPVNLTCVYQAGYTNAAAVPAALCHAIKTHVAHLYNFREPIATGRIEAVPHSLDAFYRQRSFNLGIG